MQFSWSIVLLAAGASARLGRPKQLLKYGRSTLLGHSLEAALSTTANGVVVVLGANAHNIQPLTAPKKLVVVTNPHWQEGIASSIRLGLNRVLVEIPDTGLVLFMPCDQPFINPALMDNLVTLQQQTGKPIAASSYAGTLGIPAVFSKTLFDELHELTGDAGAKKIILQHLADTVSIPFSGGEVDIDTPADLEQLRKGSEDAR